MNRRIGLFGLALALVLPIAACETKEKPPVIDTTSEAKMPTAPNSIPVSPTGPAAK